MIIRLTVVNAATGDERTGIFRLRAQLRIVKVRALLMLGIRPPRPGKHEIAKDATGDALDETQRIRDLGLNWDDKLYVREASKPEDIKFICSDTGCECVEPCLKDEVLGDVELRVLPQVGLAIADKDLYGVASSAGGTPMDESDTLSGLGVFNAGQVLYTVALPQVSLTFMSMVTGATTTASFGIAMTLGAVKISILPDLNMPVTDPAAYGISTSPYGTELDEAETLEQIGLTADGTVLYVYQK